MATQEDARRIALSLPATVEDDERFAFAVMAGGKPKWICWDWLERVEPRKARVPNPEVLGVRVSGEEEKQLLLASDERKFFTEPHYDGYPAILVRLAEVDAGELRELIVDAWRCKAPKKLVKEFDG